MVGQVLRQLHRIGKAIAIPIDQLATAQTKEYLVLPTLHIKVVQADEFGQVCGAESEGLAQPRSAQVTMVGRDLVVGPAGIAPGGRGVAEATGPIEGFALGRGMQVFIQVPILVVQVVLAARGCLRHPDAAGRVGRGQRLGGAKTGVAGPVEDLNAGVAGAHHLLLVLGDKGGDGLGVAPPASRIDDVETGAGGRAVAAQPGDDPGVDGPGLAGGLVGGHPDRAVGAQQMLPALDAKVLGRLGDQAGGGDKAHLVSPRQPGVGAVDVDPPGVDVAQSVLNAQRAIRLPGVQHGENCRPTGHRRRLRHHRHGAGHSIVHRQGQCVGMHPDRPAGQGAVPALLGDSVLGRHGRGGFALLMLTFQVSIQC